MGKPKFWFRNVLTLCFTLTLLVISAQEKSTSRKGQLYFYWGWNRNFYSNSDIHFIGNNYDFTLYDVKAKDLPRHFNFENYFSPGNITIPQYNFRIGYYLSHHYDISVGSDHMKYVVRNFQNVLISGYIKSTGTIYNGNFNKNVINLSKDFLELEHTDGLNYANIEIRRSDLIFQKRFFALESRFGVGTGILYPRTYSVLLGMPTHDEFHLSGFGLGVVGGIHLGFFKHFFIQFESKLGYINMPDILTTEQSSDKASQSFYFSQFNGVLGFKFKLI